MKISDKKKIGNRTYTITGEGKNLFECLYELSSLSFGDVEKCGICQSDKLILNARIAGKKKFEYAEVKCLSCRASVVFGKMQENPNMFFLRKNDTKQPDWVRFNKEQTDEDLENLLNNTKK